MGKPKHLGWDKTLPNRFSPKRQRSFYCQSNYSSCNTITSFSSINLKIENFRFREGQLSINNWILFCASDTWFVKNVISFIYRRGTAFYPKVLIKFLRKHFKCVFPFVNNNSTRKSQVLSLYDNPETLNKPRGTISNDLLQLLISAFSKTSHFTSSVIVFIDSFQLVKEPSIEIGEIRCVSTLPTNIV